MADYLIGYYLNCQDTQALLTAQQDDQLKLLLGCLSVHLTLRPPDETVAWTLQMSAEPPYSLFATGSSAGQYLVGQVLTDDIRGTDISNFHSQMTRTKGESSKSIIRKDTQSVLEIVDEFYRQSEQIPFKIIAPSDTDELYALAGMPGYDQAWFDASEPLLVYQQLDKIPHKPIKECSFEFRCDCSAEKLLPFFESIDDETLEELYGDSPTLTVNCPRCGKSFAIDRLTLKRNLT